MKWITKVPVEISKTSLSGIPWEKQIILVTVHRRENFGPPLDNIFTALIELARKFQDSTCLVYPVHLIQISINTHLTNLVRYQI